MIWHVEVQKDSLLTFKYGQLEILKIFMWGELHRIKCSNSFVCLGFKFIFISNFQVISAQISLFVMPETFCDAV